MHRHVLIDSKYDTCDGVTLGTIFTTCCFFHTISCIFAKIAFPSRKIERFKFSSQNLFIGSLHILKMNFLLSIFFQFFCNWKKRSKRNEKDNIEITKLNNKYNYYTKLSYILTLKNMIQNVRWFIINYLIKEKS